jgi:serine/threonine-protein kinase
MDKRTTFIDIQNHLILPRLKFRYVIAFGVLLFFSACSKSSTTHTNLSVTSTLISIIPDSGRFGTVDTLIGTGFVQGDSVAFNGVTAVIQRITTDTIIAIVPKYAGTGAISVSMSGDTVKDPTFHYIYTAIVSTFSGSRQRGHLDGSATTAEFQSVYGIVLDKNGNLFVADYNNSTSATAIRKIAPDGSVTTFAGSVDSLGWRDDVGTGALFSGVDLFAIDDSNNLIIPDGFNSVIRKVTASEVVTTIAGNGVRGFADGVPATAEFDKPNSAAVDSKGNIYITDQVSRIRQISTDGTVSTFAGGSVSGSTDGPLSTATLFRPADLAIDGYDNFYLCTDDAKIRKISSAGIVSTIAANTLNNGYVDGPAQAALFNVPNSIVVDKSGNIYIADTYNNVIRMLSSDLTTVSTFAGNGTMGYQDGPVNQAEFTAPIGLVIDTQGNIYVTDSGNFCIRKISFE